MVEKFLGDPLYDSPETETYALSVLPDDVARDAAVFYRNSYQEPATHAFFEVLADRYKGPSFSD